MARTWLLIDVSGLGYRSLYAMPDLSHEGVGTGAVFGILRTVTDLQEMFHAHVVWCFDGGYNERLAIFPEYKAQRKPDVEDDEKAAARSELAVQLNCLRTDYLPNAGFWNILRTSGLEADDVMASVALHLPKGDEAVIVSSDDDMLQCLRPRRRVCIWKPGKTKLVTAERFTEEWGLMPQDWSEVKAIAGCPGDGVPGVRGVGPKTAAKYLRGELKETTKAYQAIESFVRTPYAERNRRLVRLPFESTPTYDLVEDWPTQRRWDNLMTRLGMKSLKGRRA